MIHTSCHYCTEPPVKSGLCTLHWAKWQTFQARQGLITFPDMFQTMFGQSPYSMFPKLGVSA